MKTTGQRIKHGQISESDPNLVFWSYQNGREYWVTSSMYASMTSRSLENKRKRYWNNREAALEKQKSYVLRNKEKILQKNRKYDEARSKCPKRREWIKNWTKSKRQSDPSFDISKRLRIRVANALKKKNSYKSQSTEDLLGCKWNFFIKWIESQFKDGMSWDNRNLWHIDHIKPCCSFDLSNKEQQKQCFHYTNLQPLWAEENLRKNGRY